MRSSFNKFLLNVITMVIVFVTVVVIEIVIEIVIVIVTKIKDNLQLQMTDAVLLQSFSSMFGASSTKSGKKSSFDRLPFFSAAMLQEGHFKQDSGLESPPASLDNR